MTTITYAQTLLKDGFVVLPTTLSDLATRNQAQHDFIMTLKQFPEFTTDAYINKAFVLGGFSALGNPSSFHNPFVRNLRQQMHTELYHAIFSELMVSHYPDHNLEQLIDRMMFRPAGRVPVAESFHRDDSGGLASDLSMGGWLNINDDDHIFSCVPGTHCLDADKKVSIGFSKLSKPQQAEMKGQRELIKVPAGHAIIFVDNIVHEVLARKCKFDLMRVFLGFRLTTENQPLDRGLISNLMSQSVIKLKSGQIPCMYAALHISNWINKVEDFSRHIQPEFTTDFTFKTGTRVGQSYVVVPRFMPDLETLSFLTKKNLKYKEYTDREMAIHHPYRPQTLV